MRPTTRRAATTGMSALAAFVGLALAPALAAGTMDLSLEPHARFFSAETKQPKPVDPHVFVHDAAAPAGTGPQNVAHVAGVRPALIDTDAPTTPLVTAENKPLGLDLGHWLGAKGRAIVTSRPDGTAGVELSFSNLIANGRYSVFENHFDQSPVSFTPLDGTGEHNAFVANADGTAKISIPSPNTPTHANAVLLVYHSDGQTYGRERGAIGVSAHHQLIARP